MGLFSGCLLASDIDGTLLHDGMIPQRNIDAIEWFKAEGGIFTLATGRAIDAARYSYDIVRPNAPVIALHGGCIYDYEKQNFLHHTVLEAEARPVLQSIMRDFPEIGVELFSGIHIYEIRSSKGTRWHAAYESLKFEPLPAAYETLDWDKILLALDDTATLEALKAYCAKQKVETFQFWNTMNVENAIYYEMVPNSVNKGDAAQILKRLFGAKIVYGIGDYFNDIELITKTDFGATTAGAPEDIKQLAKYISCRCEDGAVADFIEYISTVVKGS